MIVNYSEKGWEIITQRAHGVLAAQLAIHWQLEKPPDYWLETILAIAEHDDAENELDGESCLTDVGGPINFSMKQFDLENCQKLSSLSLTKSRYIALLTSLHMDFLYRKESKNNNIAKVFLQQQKKARVLWQKQLNISTTELQRTYRLLEWCDACSLLICQRSIPPEGRCIEVSKGPAAGVNELSQAGENTLTINPWPFNRKSFPVSYESRTIAELKFDSSSTFRKAFLTAPVALNKWIIKKGESG